MVHKHKYLVEDMVEFFKAMGDFNRLTIIKILASDVKDRICVIDLAKMLGISQPAASQHIKILKNIKILLPKKEGYHTYYYINKEVMQQYKNKFDEVYDLAFKQCPHFKIRSNKK